MGSLSRVESMSGATKAHEGVVPSLYTRYTKLVEGRAPSHSPPVRALDLLGGSWDLPTRYDWAKLVHYKTLQYQL